MRNLPQLALVPALALVLAFVSSACGGDEGGGEFVESCHDVCAQQAAGEGCDDTTETECRQVCDDASLIPESCLDLGIAYNHCVVDSGVEFMCDENGVYSTDPSCTEESNAYGRCVLGL